jgi:hypothetical protein
MGSSSGTTCSGDGSGGTSPTDGGCTTIRVGDNCSITCSCPEGVCQCGIGGTQSTVPFAGCPACPSFLDVPAICGVH